MSEQNAHFHIEPLRDMVAVGAVGSHSVRLWMRVERPGDLHLCWWPDGQPQHQVEGIVQVPMQNEHDNTMSVLVPEDFPPVPPLVPLQRYRFRVVHGADAHIVGEGRFETAPVHPEEMPQRFAIALMSCHQPFSPEGNLRTNAIHMLRATRRCLEQHNTKCILMVGDQMYADYPHNLSLFNERFFGEIAPPGRKRVQDCTPAEIRRLYQERYRLFWSLPEWQALHADYPCYPILDDHEIVDNWGSVAVHQQPEWQAIGVGARAAYFDYQGSRILPCTATLPEDFHYAVSYGDLAIFVMDLRSGRRTDGGGQLYSHMQAAALQAFLDEHQAKSLLFIVLSVPVVHLPSCIAQWMARLGPDGEDFSDRWSAETHLQDRNRFLSLLRAHQHRAPHQRVCLLSGDIHIGCAHEIRWQGSDCRFYQLVSSGITHHLSRLVSLVAGLSIRYTRRVVTQDPDACAAVHFLRGSRGANRNPYGGLNLGIIDIETPATGGKPQVRFLLYGHQGDEPTCVYRSPPL
jgi:alkaline phosphatase D